MHNSLVTPKGTSSFFNCKQHTRTYLLLTESTRLTCSRAEKEADRLAKNKERTHKREKQKKMLAKNHGGEDGSPEPAAEKATGTTRKCANCGQVGHIKTNKKYGNYCLFHPPGYPFTSRCLLGVKF